jgi:hypothetical protein
VKSNLSQPSFPVIQKERAIAKFLFKCLRDCLTLNVAVEEATLDYFNENDQDEEELEEQSSSQASSFSQMEEFKGIYIEKESFDISYMQRAVECYNQYGWKTLQNPFRRVKHRNYISRFKAYLESSGTRFKKLEQIKNYVVQNFKQVRLQYLPVHDRNIKRWAF